jgi:hypothetical protein
LQLLLLLVQLQLFMTPLFASLTRELLDLRATLLGSTVAPFALIEDCCCSSCCCCVGCCI